MSDSQPDKHHPNFAPSDSDFEEVSRNIVEIDPKMKKLRGASNRDGDDGLYENEDTGDRLTIEAKHYKQHKAIPKRDIVNLREATARNNSLGNGKGRGQLYSTSGSLSLPARTELRDAKRNGEDIAVTLYNGLEDLAANETTPKSISTPLKASLAEKGRRTKSSSGT